MRLSRRPARVHYRDSSMVSRRNSQISFMYPDKESPRLLLKPILVVARIFRGGISLAAATSRPRSWYGRRTE